MWSSPDWLCLSEDLLTDVPLRVLSPQHLKKGTKHEQVCKSIARHLALSTSPGMGTEIPLPDTVRASKARCLQMHHGVLPAAGMRGSELNVQADHVHLLAKIPPRRSVSDLMGTLKGRKYCVDTVAKSHSTARRKHADKRA